MLVLVSEIGFLLLLLLLSLLLLGNVFSEPPPPPPTGPGLRSRTYYFSLHTGIALFSTLSLFYF